MKFALPALPALLLAATPAFAFAAPAACPTVTDQLTESLASAKQRTPYDGEVRVEFDVTADGRTRLVDLQGSRSYRVPVRLALETLACEPGTPQRYVLNIRFVDPAPRAVASAASATVAQAAPR